MNEDALGVCGNQGLRGDPQDRQAFDSGQITGLGAQAHRAVDDCRNDYTTYHSPCYGEIATKVIGDGGEVRKHLFVNNE